MDDVGPEKVQKSLDTARTEVTKASKAVYERLESVTGKNATTSALNQVARERVLD